MKTWLRDNPEHYPFNPSEKNSQTIGKLGFPPRALCRRPFGIGHRTHAIHSAGPSRVPGGARSRTRCIIRAPTVSTSRNRAQPGRGAFSLADSSFKTPIFVGSRPWGLSAWPRDHNGTMGDTLLVATRAPPTSATSISTVPDRRPRSVHGTHCPTSSLHNHIDENPLAGPASFSSAQSMTSPIVRSTLAALARERAPDAAMWS